MESKDLYGLLIDYEYCDNCMSCVVSCKVEHNYGEDQWGIRVHADGPWEIEPGHMNFNYLPAPTDLCDLCADRTADGREPLCVHHCMCGVMKYGKVEDLFEEFKKKPKQVIWTPQYKPYANKPEFKSEFKTQKRLEALGEFEGEAFGDGQFFNTFADTHAK